MEEWTFEIQKEEFILVLIISLLHPLYFILLNENKKAWVELVSGNVTIVIRIDILATQLHPTAGINNASAGKCKILQTVVNGHERARTQQNIKKIPGWAWNIRSIALLLVFVCTISNIMGANVDKI